MFDKSIREKRNRIIEDLEILAEETGYHSSVQGAIALLDNNNPRSKGDYMEAVQEMDGSIKVMDSAIPQVYSEEMEKLGIDRSFYVMAYYKNGTSGLLNVVARWAILINNS